MKEYRIAKSRALEVFERTLDFTAEEQVKIKVTKALVDREAAKIYSDCEVKNIIPLMSAAAVVSEPQQNGEYRRGERVYIDPYFPCENCYYCKVDDRAHCSDMDTAGINTDGFLTEFKIVGKDSIKMLPDSVSDEEALFIELTSRAINIIDRLAPTKGEYIVISGSDILSNILCQISLYYQFIPILVTNNPINVDIAKKKGIYYTTAADSESVGFIRQITGGRMAENMVCLASSDLPAKHVADCCSMGANVVFSGESGGSFISYNAALKKQLNLSFVPDGYGNITSAINVLANKAVTTDMFVSQRISFQNAVKAFDLQSSEAEDAAAISAVIVEI